MSIIVDGNKIADSILLSVKQKILDASAKPGFTRPKLAVFLVGNDSPSRVYVRKKEEAAMFCGIEFLRLEFPDSISLIDLKKEIKSALDFDKPSGVIIQLPLPDKLKLFTSEIVNSIDSSVDVDCLSYEMIGRVLNNRTPWLPPTPAAMLEILDFYGVTLDGKAVCVVGRGELVGKPLVAMLLNRPVSLSVIGRSTENPRKYIKEADVIFTGVGKKGLITGDMLKNGAAVIDAGIIFDEGKMYGDVDFESASAVAGLITPVPGGVGPITVAKLLENVYVAYEMQNATRLK